MIQYLAAPLTIVQGRNETFGPITWYSGAPVAPVNLTGCTANFVIAVNAQSGNLISVSTTSNAQGVITLGGVNGTILVALTAAATAILPVGGFGGISAIYQTALRYQLDLVFPNNYTWPFAMGVVSVLAPA
jgi:hypothetical protein